MGANDRLSIRELKSFIAQCTHEAEALEKAALNCPPEGTAMFLACAAQLRYLVREASELLEKLREIREGNGNGDSL